MHGETAKCVGLRSIYAWRWTNIHGCLDPNNK